ncbi:MAG: DUF3160 domain-containing protein, partial [Chloroflexi bacterium]|nr:DUF3160 domain-containing protein [Chloroflexota bacterium]
MTFIAAPSMAGDQPEKSAALFRKKEILTELKGYGEPAKLAESLSVSGISVQTTKGYNEIYDLYNEYTENIQPVFITTDILFHTTHKVFDYSLRIIELEQFPLLKDFSKEMYETAVRLKKELGNKNDDLAGPADHLIAYFAVSNILLGNEIKIEDALKKKVDLELELIRASKGFAFSKILNQKEDYSQYTVRGHYTRNENLGKYFLASMWYGRRMFRFDETKPDGAGIPKDTPDV